MLAVIVGLAAGVAILLLVEKLHDMRLLRMEVARKIIHVVTGLILVIWPFFIAWKTIIIVELAFMVIVWISRYLKLFNSQHGINRITWGEFFYPLGVVLIILLGAPRWVFILAVLHLALADTAAALVGKMFGKSNTYYVFGQKKSWAGTAAFFVTSVILVTGTFIFFPQHVAELSEGSLVLLPLVATGAENLGVYGLDNFLIPLTVVLFLS